MNESTMSPSPSAPAPRRERVCVHTELCRRILGMPRWRWSTARVTRSGFRYSGAGHEVEITRKQIAVFRVQWERETRMCAECGGSAVNPVSASAAGTTYRWCPACDGTGDAGGSR